MNSEAQKSRGVEGLAGGLCATVCPRNLIKDFKVEALPDPGLVHSRNNPDAVVK